MKNRRKNFGPQNISERIGNIEKLVFFSLVLFLFFKAFLWLLTHIPTKKITLIIWWIALVTVMLIESFSLGTTIGMLMLVMGSGGTALNKIIGDATVIKTVVGVISLSLFVGVIVIYPSEDSLSYWSIIISIAIGLYRANQWVWKRLSSTE